MPGVDITGFHPGRRAQRGAYADHRRERFRRGSDGQSRVPKDLWASPSWVMG